MDTPPKDVYGWYEKAMEFHNNYLQDKRIEEMARQRVRYSSSGQKYRPYRQDHQDHSVPMDIDKATTNQLSEEQVQDYISKGLCFKCAKKGHRSRDCPTKPKVRKAKIVEVEESETEEGF
jgi:Zinc knuckle